MSFPVTWRVMINGNDASSRMNPFVQSIECSGKAGGTADSATITFNDHGGQIILPPKNTPIQIYIQERLRFEGKTDVPQAVKTRGGGQALEVSCSSIDKGGKAKQAQRAHADDCTLKDFLEQSAKRAGMSIKVDDSLGAIHRDHWSTRGQNFLQLGQAMADELGATFKVRGSQAVFAKRGQGAAPGGGTTPTIKAISGVNLIECRLSPYEGRPRFAKARVRFYDRGEAKWKQKEVEVGTLSGDVADVVGGSQADEASAGDAAEGRKTASEREGGSGSITILLNVDAEAEGICEVEGVRPGIDGPYRIETWRDKVERDGGAETELTLKQPQGSAGEDDRKAGEQ